MFGPNKILFGAWDIVATKAYAVGDIARVPTK